MTNTLPIFKFVSLRSPEATVLAPANEISIASNLALSLEQINESSDDNLMKLSKYNGELQEFIDSSEYFKNLAELALFSQTQLATPTASGLAQLYDNILLRTITKSNTNQVYKQLVDLFKELYVALNGAGTIEVIIPSAITPKFLDFSENLIEAPAIDTSIEILLQQENLTHVQMYLIEAEKDNITGFSLGN